MYVFVAGEAKERSAFFLCVRNIAWAWVIGSIPSQAEQIDRIEYLMNWVNF